MRLIQIVGADEGRRLAIASDDELSVVDGFRTAYDAAHAALSAGVPFSEFLGALPVTLRLSYDEVYNARTPWKILPPFDHPDEPARCMVSGTGLTHLASAETRQKMHAGLRARDRQHAHVPLGRRRRQSGAGRDRHRARMVL